MDTVQFGYNINYKKNNNPVWNNIVLFTKSINNTSIENIIEENELNKKEKIVSKHVTIPREKFLIINKKIKQMKQSNCKKYQSCNFRACSWKKFLQKYVIFPMIHFFFHDVL